MHLSCCLNWKLKSNKDWNTGFSVLVDFWQCSNFFEDGNEQFGHALTTGIGNTPKQWLFGFCWGHTRDFKSWCFVEILHIRVSMFMLFEKTFCFVSNDPNNWDMVFIYVINQATMAVQAFMAIAISIPLQEFFSFIYSAIILNAKPLKSDYIWDLKLNIARGTTDPGYWLHILNKSLS